MFSQIFVRIIEFMVSEMGIGFAISIIFSMAVLCGFVLIGSSRADKRYEEVLEELEKLNKKLDERETK